MPAVFDPASLPEGFIYLPGAISRDEEGALLTAIRQLPLEPAKYRGFTAKRRIVHFEDAVPDFLTPLRDTMAGVAGIDAGSLTTALVTEYAAGAVMGWHRDAPQYGPVVIGVSLQSACRMRLRRIAANERGDIERAAVILQPRSAYVMGGTARAEWQHSIPAVDALRYSITFRSKRTRSGRTGGVRAAYR